jgi:hypothetical protein
MGLIISAITKSEFVDEVIEAGDFWLETLSLSDAEGDTVGEGVGFKRITTEFFPMVEHALREGTSWSGGTEGLSETEGFSDWEVSLNHDEWGSGDWFFTDNDTSTLGKATIDTTYCIIRALNFDQEDWLLEAGLGSEFSGEEDTSGSWGNLTTTSVDSISVESNILDVESDTSHVLISHNTFLGWPLESSLARVLDFVHELALFGNINKQVGTSGLRTEAPNLLCIIGVPLVFVLENLVSDLDVLFGGNFLALNGVGKVVTEGESLTENSVVLVGRLGQARLAGFGWDGFSVWDDGVTLLEWAFGVLFFEILEANFDVEFTATSNDVFAWLFSCANNEGVGLGEFAETFDELGEVGSVLDFDGDTHDWGDWVLHHTDAVGIVVIWNGTLLDEVSIDTDETDGVTARNIWNSFDFTSHHEDGSLNVLNVKVILGAWLVVGSHNSNFLASSDGTSENTTEGVETTTIGGWDHLGDEDHEGTVLVAGCNGLTAWIIDGTFVKVSSSVLLGLFWGWELHDDHFEEGLSSVDPLLADDLHKILKTSFFLFSVKDDLELIQHLPDSVKVTIHNIADEGNDWLHDELDEASWEFTTAAVWGISCELFLLWREVVITPELLHELCEVELELVSIYTCEAGKGEGPAEKSGTESDGTVGWVDLLRLAHIIAFVGWNNDVCILNNTLEVLIHGLTINLEFEDTTINLVDEKNWLDLFTEGLTEDGLGLDANTFDVIDDDEGTVSDTESSSDLWGEVDVSRWVNKVDKIWEGINLVNNVGLEVKWDTSGLDGDTTFFLVSTSVGGTNITSLIASNNTGFGNEGVSEGWFTVIDVSNNRHVTDLISVTHDFSNLVNSEVWHCFGVLFIKLLIVIN